MTDGPLVSPALGLMQTGHKGAKKKNNHDIYTSFTGIEEWQEMGAWSMNIAQLLGTAVGVEGAGRSGSRGRKIILATWYQINSTS